MIGLKSGPKPMLPQNDNHSWLHLPPSQLVLNIKFQLKYMIILFKFNKVIQQIVDLERESLSRESSKHRRAFVLSQVEFC